ncbi:MAG: 50S ribosomal protein L15 [Deltaproteobacteria bacterium DG_8]|nr:MAG: 50S ribosomal protein L15 [Deltaproteobacteria bacterium DG_8]
MKINQLKPPKGAIKKRKRVGRGPGSGHGKTACRGHKGFNSRSGGGVPPGFEGGQMPLKRRLPKRGFHNIFRRRFATINIRDLIRFEKGSVVDVKTLITSGLVKRSHARIKLLGEGKINYPLTLKVHSHSKAAKEKIEAAGGKVEII